MHVLLEYYELFFLKLTSKKNTYRYILLTLSVTVVDHCIRQPSKISTLV